MRAVGRPRKRAAIDVVGLPTAAPVFSQNSIDVARCRDHEDASTAAATAATAAEVLSSTHHHHHPTVVGVPTGSGCGNHYPYHNNHSSNNSNSNSRNSSGGGGTAAAAVRIIGVPSSSVSSALGGLMPPTGPGVGTGGRHRAPLAAVRHPARVAPPTDGATAAPPPTFGSSSGGGGDVRSASSDINGISAGSSGNRIAHISPAVHTSRCVEVWASSVSCISDARKAAKHLNKTLDAIGSTLRAVRRNHSRSCSKPNGSDDSAARKSVVLVSSNSPAYETSSTDISCAASRLRKMQRLIRLVTVDIPLLTGRLRRNNRALVQCVEQSNFLFQGAKSLSSAVKQEATCLLQEAAWIDGQIAEAEAVEAPVFNLLLSQMPSKVDFAENCNDQPWWIDESEDDCEYTLNRLKYEEEARKSARMRLEAVRSLRIEAEKRTEAAKQKEAALVSRLASLQSALTEISNSATLETV